MSQGGNEGTSDYDVINQDAHKVEILNVEVKRTDKVSTGQLLNDEICEAALMRSEVAVQK